MEEIVRERYNLGTTIWHGGGDRVYHMFREEFAQKRQLHFFCYILQSFVDPPFICLVMASLVYEYICLFDISICLQIYRKLYKKNAKINIPCWQFFDTCPKICWLVYIQVLRVAIHINCLGNRNVGQCVVLNLQYLQYVLPTNMLVGVQKGYIFIPLKLSS